MSARLISIIVPVYNEQDSVAQLVREIREIADRFALDIEVLFVDDGSTDMSWSIIERLTEQDSSLGGVRFRRNVGKAAALMAGFSIARGDVVVMMDADLQDPPEELPRLLDKLDEGYDVVSGWKRKRHDPWHKVYPSRVFNKLISTLTGVHLHDHVCGLKCLRRHVTADMRLYGELHRFIGVLAGAHGYRVTEIPTSHRPRTTGESKYGFSRFAKGFVDLISVLLTTRFRWRPQHLIGVLGAWLIVVCPLLVFASLFSAVVARLIGALMVGVAGVVLLALGLIAEMLTAQRPMGDLYDIVERVGRCRHRVPKPPLDPAPAFEHDAFS